MMKPKPRTLVRRSFMALVTGTSALALQACGSDSGDPQGNNSARQTEESGGNSDSDSQ